MNWLQVAVGVIKNDKGRILISHRHPSLHQGGLWEFPGGKVEAGETIEQALYRELKEELDIAVLTSTPLITLKHRYPDKAVQLHVFLVDRFIGSGNHAHDQEIKWVEPSALTDYRFPDANRPIITAARLPHFYAIWDEAFGSNPLSNLNKILLKGVKLIQARLKSLPDNQALPLIEKAYRLCQQHDAVLLINSQLAFADEPQSQACKTAEGVKEPVMADGIHLTSRHLMSLQKRPAHHKWVAASCHNLAELQHAQKINVDFAVLAPVLPTPTHPDAIPLGWEQFSKWVADINIPVYALGGMTVASLAVARQFGAQGIAGIRGFLDA
ncbi:MAG: Nudix family hydrolase [Gammaproteobacteria bacterium]